MSVEPSQVPEQIRDAIEAMPVIADALERCIEAFAVEWHKAMVAAGFVAQRLRLVVYSVDEAEALCDDMLSRSGTDDLRRMLEVVADRLHEHGFGGNPLPSRGVSRDDAAERLATIAGCYR